MTGERIRPPRAGNSGRSIAVFCGPQVGHFQRMHSLISALTGGGAMAHVFTHRMFAPKVEQAGGVFFDLFSRYPLEPADDESLPFPVRYVTYAGTYARQIRRVAEKTRPSLVIHDSHAVIGQAVAKLLGIPRVNVCSGHNLTPELNMASIKRHQRVKISPRCLRAVEVLKRSCGMIDASPFAFAYALSPHLNIYCEPPEFLTPEERAPFEPVAFFGSLPSNESERRVGSEAPPWPGSGDNPHAGLYVSFGTIIWKHFADEALWALARISEAFAGMRDIRVIISLGGTRIDDRAREALSRPNVAVADYVDQWRVLKDADAFITHHGLNSTHEAVFHRVPMISYPFFWDQPGLADKCRKLGLAIPLTDSPRAHFSVEDVRIALKKLTDGKKSIQHALSRAREWEMAVIADRPAVVKQVFDL